jgi:hypothetical protein
MTRPLTPTAFFGINNKLRELLGLLDALRAIREPLHIAEGLRASLELVLKLAEFAGVDRTWTDRVRTILDNPRVFDIVLAVVRYLDGLMDGEQAARMIAETESAGAEAFEAQDFIDWFPLILQIITLLRELRRTAKSNDK